MPAVDRAVLRIGSYELGWEPELPVGVVIDEAVELARQYSTADSGRFVHALLARIADQVRAVSTAPPAPPAPLEVQEPELEEVVVTDRPWLVIVWNDPVNLMSYVVFVFQKLFGYSREKATRLMLQVHHDGKAVVSDGNREKAEADVARLHAHGLWATMEHPS